MRNGHRIQGGMKLDPMFVQSMGRCVQSYSFNHNKRLERSDVQLEKFCLQSLDLCSFTMVYLCQKLCVF